MDKNILAGSLKSQGGKLLELGISSLLGPKPTVDEPTPARPKLARRLAGGALLRIASRSIPGAIVVTGGMLAKAAHDRRKAKRNSAGKKPASS